MEEKPNTHVSWFLMASYAYYVCNESIISDALYDEICKWLKEHHETISHPHKHLISSEMWSIGSAYYLKEYPLIVQSSTIRLIYNLFPNGRSD